MGCLRSEKTGQLSPIDAILLGVVQGPAELLPISSSAHLAVVPWLLGRPYSDLDPELRKAIEVALHAGTAVALLVGRRQLVATEMRDLDRRRLTVLVLSLLPPAVVGLALERPIERRLGGPGTTAIGLVGGAVAMALADRRPGSWRPSPGVPRCSSIEGETRRGPSGQGRRREEADWCDGLALGLAQAAALAPGVSRNGATLAAARGRGFSRADANLLSRVVALPVILGASFLKGIRLSRRRDLRGNRLTIGLAIGVSSLSTLASQRLIGRVEHDGPLWPYAAYRVLLAGLIMARRRRPRKVRSLQNS